MSASAESLDSIECHSNSLLSILDEVFKPNHQKITPPTSNMSSSKRNSLFNSHSYRSESTTNTSPQNELVINPCNHDAHDMVDEPNQYIGVITEENPSNSEMIASYCVDTIENSVNIDCTSELQWEIVKQPLKKSYSYNDIVVRRILTLNKKSGSIQTFTSIDATLSVEIIKCDNTQGNYKSTIKISHNRRLISKELYKSKIIINGKIKNAAFKFKRLPYRKNNLIHFLINGNSIRKLVYSKSSIEFQDFYNIQMLNNTILKKLHYNYFKSNLHNDEIDIPSYTCMGINELNINDHKYQGDDHISLKVNDLQVDNKIWKKCQCFHGDEKSEISELSQLEGQCPDKSQSPSTSATETPSRLRSFITNPIVLSTLAFGGLLLLIPTYHKLSHWLSTVTNIPPINTLPEVTQSSTTLPTFRLQGSRVINSFGYNFRHILIY